MLFFWFVACAGGWRRLCLPLYQWWISPASYCCKTWR